MTNHEIDYDGPDLEDVVGNPDNFSEGCRTNDTLGEQCSVCANELLYDRYENMVYCVNDWYHG